MPFLATLVTFLFGLALSGLTAWRLGSDYKSLTWEQVGVEILWIGLGTCMVLTALRVWTGI